MTLAFAGFPTATFEEMGTAALVLATIRAECDRLGRCRKDQRFLAGKARLKLPTLSYHVKRFERLGVITLIKYSRRKSAVIIIRPEHRWATPEKPAPRPSECSTFLNTSSKARESKKEPPVSPPLDAGGDPPGVSNSEGQEEPRTEAAAEPAAEGGCITHPPPPPACITHAEPELIPPGEAGTRPWRNRQPRPAKVWINGRWRRPPRELRPGPSPITTMKADFMAAAVARAVQCGELPAQMLPPSPKILPPGGQASRRTPNGPITKQNRDFLRAAVAVAVQCGELPPEAAAAVGAAPPIFFHKEDAA